MLAKTVLILGLCLFLCTGTDFNVKTSGAKAEIVDSVNVIRIVTSSFCVQLGVACLALR